ncbi:ATP-dependent Clp protease proteolytic subunit [Candidatus Odyssella thessalonicensis]|uniref:ATP-dependent Clp protease proteolytic subunit n=1 Tax=Candidatus Odyssella thessalonicensis TaxID=84647 RepID=UPI000225C149|nr:ATP-dependent Clp protease proteolytic subunit [Candidatus Odyssella thessalonicensis]
MMLDNKYEEDPKNPDSLPSLNPFLNKKLLETRTVLIFGEINMELAQRVSSELLILAHSSPQPINVIINSPGGHVESGDTLYDFLRFIDVPVNVIGTGWVASAGALIFLGGKKNRRFVLPNTRFLLHQPLGGMQGKALDIKIQAEEIIKMRERINSIIAKETGNPIEKVRAETERDFWLSAEEGIQYGLAHRVITSLKDLPSVS